MQESSAPNFNVDAALLGDVAAVVTIEGEADLYTAPQLKDAFSQVMDEERTYVLVDLTKSTFVDSTTLGLLLNVTEQLRTSGGGLAITCLDPNIKRIFELTLLDQVFPIFETRAAGEEYLNNLAESGPA